MFAFGETITFLAPTVIEDDYGNTTHDWSNPTVALTKQHAGVEPRPVSVENHDSRNAVTDGFTLYWIDEVFDVDPTWRAVVRVDQLDVLGPEAGWVSPFTGWEAGTVVQVGGVNG